MKTVLLYLPSEDESEYGNELSKTKITRFEYQLDHGSLRIFPVGTEIRLLDYSTKKIACFRIVKQSYFMDAETLTLKVMVDDENTALSPDEFFQFIFFRWQQRK